MSVNNGRTAMVRFGETTCVAGVREDGDDLLLAFPGKLIELRTHREGVVDDVPVRVIAWKESGFNPKKMVQVTVRPIAATEI